jgi:hypothetical protein
MECSICEDKFSTPGPMTPKITPCGHTFCQGCMGRLPPPMTCPTCRQNIVLPGGDVASLITNFVALGGAAESSGGGAAAVPPQRSAPPSACIHKEPLQWWCCTHAMPICVHCTVLDHPKGQCDCKFLKTIADEARKELVNGPVEAKAVALEGVVVQNKAKPGELKALGETKKREFRAAVTVIKNAADARVRTFEAEVDAAVARGCAEMFVPMTAAAEVASKTVNAVVAEQRSLALQDDKTVMQRKDALVEKLQAAIAVNAEGLKAVVPDIQCVLQPEEVVAAVARCLPSPELVGVFPSVKIAGATGPESEIVNGVYRPTGRLHNGKALFQKSNTIKDAVNYFLSYAPNRLWIISAAENIEANNDLGWAHSAAVDLDHPSLASSWLVTTGNKFEAQPAVTSTLI